MRAIVLEQASYTYALLRNDSNMWNVLLTFESVLKLVYALLISFISFDLNSSNWQAPKYLIIITMQRERFLSGTYTCIMDIGLWLQELYVSQQVYNVIFSQVTCLKRSLS